MKFAKVGLVSLGLLPYKNPKDFYRTVLYNSSNCVGRQSLRSFLAMTALAIVPASTSYASDVDVYEAALMNYNASASPKTVDIRFSVAQDNTLYRHGRKFAELLRQGVHIR